MYRMWMWDTNRPNIFPTRCIYVIGWYEAPIWWYVAGPHSSPLWGLLDFGRFHLLEQGKLILPASVAASWPKWRSESGWIWAPSFWCKGRVGKSAEFPIPQSEKTLGVLTFKDARSNHNQTRSFPFTYSMASCGVGYTLQSVGSMFF